VISPEQAQRVRTAGAYVGAKSEPKLSALLGIERSMLRRILTGKRDWHDLENGTDFFDRVVDKTGVPRWFLQHGFSAAGDQLRESEVQRAVELTTELQAELRRLARPAAHTPPGGLGRRAKDSEPIPERRPQSARKRVAGTRPTGGR
jgi:hypothetical protein